MLVQFAVDNELTQVDIINENTNTTKTSIYPTSSSFSTLSSFVATGLGQTTTMIFYVFNAGTSPNPSGLLVRFGSCIIEPPTISTLILPNLFLGGDPDGQLMWGDGGQQDGLTLQQCTALVLSSGAKCAGYSTVAGSGRCNFYSQTCFQVMYI
jgi:hypothetical protein